MKKHILFVLFSVVSLLISAQDIRINEAVASNSVFFDEDGDTPDWFELHNYGSNQVSLKNWSITDDIDELSMWTFPDIVLQADEYLMVWASKKNRSELAYAKTLVNNGDTFKYIVPVSEPSSNWTSLDFDDSSWLSGITGFGYADDDDDTILPNGTRSVYIRSIFSISDLESLNQLILDIDYDDGFVAYINGKEIARANINGSPPYFNSGTITDHEAEIYSGGKPERFTIDNPLDILNEGNNVFCVQLHNMSSTSSDMTLIPFLSAIFSSSNSSGIVPPPILDLSSNNFHTNFKISSKSETLILSDDSGNIINELLVDGLLPDISIGTSISNGNLVYYKNPTPGTKNDSQEFKGTITNSVIFSHQGGKVDYAISLILSGNSNDEVIRYTTDATEPTESSSTFTNAIEISKNSVIRARLFNNNYIPSFTNSKTYLIDPKHDIPIVSLVTDPYNLFDQDYGIYVYGDSYDPNLPYYGANFWEDWERPIQFSFYETDGSLGTEFNAGVKIFGGWSRANAQRSLSIFARGKYGTSEIDYPLFPDLSYDKFQAVVLRNSGNDWLNTMIRDISLTSLLEGADLEYQAHRATVTYINGEYWGIYNLREKVNEHFLASKHNIDEDVIDLLEYDGQVIQGSNVEYNSLINYVETTDLKLDSNFKYVSDNIDIDNYILYQVAQIYFNNTDWPGNNIKYWKHPEGKWRWILYDTDFGFGIWNVNDYSYDMLSFALEENGPGWPNPPWSTLLFRNLIENTSFRNMFVNRFADELNTRFLPDNVNSHIQSTLNMIKTEIDSHFSRWSGNVENVNVNINNMKTFGSYRPNFIKSHIKNKFQLANIHRITINNEDISQGFVKLNNNLNIQFDSWSGDYFENVPITLKAIPKSGYEFSHWSGASSSAIVEIELSLVSEISITPHFKKSTSILKNVVINEINYKSGDVVDAKDWIELFNPNSEILDISNWLFKDDNDTHLFTIPEGTTIEPNGYLVIAKSSSSFTTEFPDIKNFIGDFDFGLSGKEDAVRIFNSISELQDAVYYTSSDPWPTCANGLGPSLELISTDLDNDFPESWDCLSSYGSPGVANSSTAGVGDIESKLITLFPNPISEYLYITGLSDKITIQVYNLNGKKILEKKVNNRLFLGSLKHGIYVIKLLVDDKTYSYKILKE